MTEERPILILGGGVYQLPLIHAARKRGLRSVVFDGDAAAPGLALGDEGRLVDISDSETVTREARRFGPGAVASIVAEVSVRTAADAAATLGLPGLDPQAAAAATDKFLMRQRFAAAGLATPRFGLVESLADAERVADEVGYPLVAKPVDNSGSRGVRRVDHQADLRFAVEQALAHSRAQRAILESFLDGTEATVETFSYNGRVEILGMSDKVRVPFPHCVAVCLTYPPYFNEELQAAIADVARRAIAAVDLDSGPAHVEVMVTAAGPVVVELAARGGGYKIFPDLLREISGVDPVEAVLDLALGREPNIRPTRSRAAVLRFFNPATTGLLRGVTGVEEARLLEGVLDVVIEAPVGHPFLGVTRDGERPGYVITVAENRDEAVTQADRAERTVVFHVDPGADGDKASAAGHPGQHRAGALP